MRNPIYILNLVYEEELKAPKFCAIDFSPDPSVNARALEIKALLSDAGEFDYDAGIRMLHCAASNGLVSAMVQLAHIEYKDPSKHESAVGWFNEAAKHGHPDAHFMLYQFYSGELENSYLPANEPLALKHIKEAARAPRFKLICVSQAELIANRQPEAREHLVEVGVRTLESNEADNALKFVYR